MHKKLKGSLAFGAVAILCACGGGGGGGSGSGGGPASSASGWVAGVFAPAANFAAQCAVPRSGIDPTTGRPFADVQGSTLTENNWLRSWTNDLYLWYDEVVDRDPALYTTPAYFDLLKTSATTMPAGTPKDKFHFTFDTAAWEALSQSGVSAGYGVEWEVVASRPPRRVVAAYTEPNSPATALSANLARGAEVLTVDGVDLVNDGTQSGVAALNAGLFPATSGATHTFTVRDLTGTIRSVTMTSANITLTPVQNVTTLSTATGTVGYLHFTDHIATAESELVDAISVLHAANITDLVLDIRYNGGGFLDIASELAFMIAGSGQTAGRTFEQIVFNAKHAALPPVPFHDTTQGFSLAEGRALPTLNLPRVYVITGSGTCSASESIINSLRGVGVNVIQIGSTTCGKPYGFFPADNCGTTYFSIQFKGVNAAGFGDYTDGFSPANTAGVIGTPVPGCSVADDFGHALGDPADARLAAALGYRASGACPAASGFAAPTLKASVSASAVSTGDGLMVKPPWRENRMLR